MAFYYIYPPDIYPTTYLNKTFPEHHFPLRNTRHKLGSLINPLYHDREQEIHKPCADVRETVDKYFIDIELPGLEIKEHLKLKWISARTLLVNATLTRPQIDEAASNNCGSENASAEPHLEPKKDETHQEERVSEEAPKQLVHLTIKERHIGNITRAFDFPVDIDRAALENKLQFGLLRITVPKQSHEKVQENHIEVEHTGV